MVVSRKESPREGLVYLEQCLEPTRRPSRRRIAYHMGNFTKIKLLYLSFALEALEVQKSIQPSHYSRATSYVAASTWRPCKEYSFPLH